MTGDKKSGDSEKSSSVGKRIFGTTQLIIATGMTVLFAVGGLSACGSKEADNAKLGKSQESTANSL